MSNVGANAFRTDSGENALYRNHQPGEMSTWNFWWWGINNKGYGNLTTGQKVSAFGEPASIF
jgi:hypothetical protein